MNDSFSGVSRGTDIGVSHVGKFHAILTRLKPTAKRGELWFACEGIGVSTCGRVHSHLFFC